jgi:putative oxidoreductase
MSEQPQSTQCPFDILKGYITPARQWLIVHGNAYAPLFLRLLLAYEFGEAGMQKWQGENWFDQLAFPFPFNFVPYGINWLLATALELIGSMALLFGVATRFFSLAFIVLTLVATAAVHWPAQWHSLAELWQGYAIIDQGHGNFKLPLMYLFMLGSLLFSGGGALTIEPWLRKQFPELAAWFNCDQNN